MYVQVKQGVKTNPLEQKDKKWAVMESQTWYRDYEVAAKWTQFHIHCVYRPPDQEEELDEVFYRELETASKSQELVLVGDFNYPDICRRSNTVKHKQSKRFLKSTDDNVLSQMMEDSTRNGVLLDLILTNREGVVGCSLGCSDYGIVEFSIGQGGSRAESKLTTMDFRRAHFSIFGDLEKIPWEQALQGIVVKAVG
ncbi:hypothetical protein BTVI_80475 [Pitangus sulphuratus]|nr:hypothetical protein BTVI_80475 [Pitangus sulphuratus]